MAEAQGASRGRRTVPERQQHTGQCV